MKIKQCNLRVLQLIDSLDAGGGERMAVNLANSLIGKVEVSGLVCTRKEGDLKSTIASEVIYQFINRKKTIDVKATMNLVKYIKQHKINMIHAHSTSFFQACLVKLMVPKIQIIWHDHYGESEALNRRPVKILKLCSFLFKAIISVNINLRDWALNNLQVKNVTYIRNFAKLGKYENHEKANLNGIHESIKIVQIANLRPQKSHLIAFEAIKLLVDEGINISLHCIGGYDEKDNYVQSLFSFIKTNKLEKAIFIYGSRNDIPAIINEADIGVLSSRSEGLPVSLLELAMAKKPVVVTDVGQCAEVVGKFGKVVPPNNSKALAEALLFYVNDPDIANQDALNLHQKVTTEFNPETITEQVVEVYTS